MVLTAKRKTKADNFNKIVSQKSIYSNPTNRITLDDRLRISSGTVLDLIRNVPGVTVNGSFLNQTVFIRGSRSTPLILIDGLPVEQSLVNSINVSDVLFIDVLKGPSAAIFGSRGANGVIAIYTGQDPDSKITKESSGIIDIVINGFDKNREFYSPDYSKNTSSKFKPDLRTTLYWNPYILLTANEENSLSFFTGDKMGDYIITTEGLSEDGEPIFGTYEFSVQENE